MSTPLREVRILLVEDSPTDALLLREALDEVTEFVPALRHAELLSDALAQLQAAHFDVALLDLGLPDSQGLDTFRKLHFLKPEMPVLVLTGLDDMSAGLLAIQDGAQDYLLKKEIQPSLLNRTIRYAIERHRVSVELRESREELKRLSANIQHVREEEKARIARELHDDLGQQLTALKMETAVLENMLKGVEAGSPDAAVRGLYSMIDQIVASVRRIAADLRPRMLDDFGLIPAVDWLINDFARRYDIRVLKHIDANEIAFNRESATAVFRMIQEALTNSARHSDATEVTVAISRDATHCTVTIADNGRGAASDARPGLKSFGLLGMRERAERLDGELKIETAPGQGFAVKITMPLATV